MGLNAHRGPDRADCEICGGVQMLTKPKFCNGVDCKHTFAGGDATGKFGEHLVRHCENCGVLTYEKTKNWTAPTPKPPPPPKPTFVVRLFSKLFKIPPKDLTS